MSEPSISADAVRLFHESVDAQNKGDHNHAYHLLLAAVNNDPKLIGGWNNLGAMLHQWKRFGPAAIAFQKAHTLALTQSLPLMNYAWNLHLIGRSAEALDLIVQVTEREDATALAWVNRSQIHLALDQVMEADKAARKAVELGPNEAMPHLALALALLRLGDYASGLEEYAARFAYVPELQELAKMPYDFWKPGMDISKKRLFIVGEQGVGDSIQFLRFVHDASQHAKETRVRVHAQCLRLFKDNLPSQIEIQPIPHEFPAADVYCPMLSLPVAMGYNAKAYKRSWHAYTINTPSPYEFPDDGAKRIGICWKGDPKHDNTRWRDCTLEMMLTLGEIPGCQLYSLQKEGRSDIEAIGTHGVMHDLAPFINDVVDTMAICKRLDVVVTVDTSVAHMSGSVGTRTFLMTPRRGLDWRWSDGEDKTIWYPHMTMVRQGVVGDWLGVIQRIRRAIVALEKSDEVA